MNEETKFYKPIKMLNFIILKIIKFNYLQKKRKKKVKNLNKI